jgi:hypothetical protein
MAYVHDKKKPIVLKQDPVDPDGTDWVYFSYGDWLRDGESIIAHSAIVENGQLVTDSTYLGDMTDSEGTAFTEVYGVQFSVDTGAASVTITHRKSTTTSGSVNLGRLNIDHSATLMVMQQ